MNEEYFKELNKCQLCPRLVECIKNVVPVGRRSKQDYHNAPVPGFGDLKARICLVGLAPGAHGANRTGRPFTGDGAGDFMYPLLHQAGFANQPESVAMNDGLQINGLYITNVVKCLPPENRPIAVEYAKCRKYLKREFVALKNLEVVLCLGQGAFMSVIKLFQSEGIVKKMGDFPFAHGKTYFLDNGIKLVGSYHTSRYNVSTKRINQKMFLDLLIQVKTLTCRENS